MKLKNCFLLFLLFSGLAVSAQDNSADDNSSVDILDPQYNHRHAVGISIGLTGYGLEYAYNFHPHFNVRARGSQLSLTDYTVEMELSNQPVLLIGGVKSTTLDLLVEYLPFTKSSFKLVGGAGYFFNAQGSVLVQYNGTIEYGDIVLDSEEIGNIGIALDYSGINPYVGFGFGRAVPKRRVGFSFEAGTYYGGSPDVTLTAEKMFEPTAEEEGAELEENLKDYSWIPYITFKLAFRI